MDGHDQAESPAGTAPGPEPEATAETAAPTAAPASSLLTIKPRRRTTAARGPAPVRPVQTQVPEAPTNSADDDRSATSQKDRLLQAGSSRLRSLLSAGRSPGRDESADTGPKATATAVPDQIVAYWSQLRGARRYPSTTDLDAEVIGAKWPNSLLIRCRSGSRALEPERVFSGERGLAASGAPGPSPAKIELSPMMLQWLLGLAGSAVRESRPMEDSETFPGATSVTYRAFALPLSQDESAIDHVLCHVCRAD